MTGDIDDYAEWDAAYLLGALAPNERREYERHLAACPACSRSVAELAGLPALLALVPAEQVVPAEEVVPTGLVVSAPPSEPAEAPERASWTRLRDAARRQRRHTRRLVTASVLGVAAALLAVALVMPGLLAPVHPAPTAGPALTLSQVQPSALSAEVQLVSESWGTRVEATCVYASSHQPSTPTGGYGTGSQGYTMFVTDRSGVSHQVASWLAGPGSTVEPVGTTPVATSDVASVDIRSAATGQVLLASSVNP